MVKKKMQKTVKIFLGRFWIALYHFAPRPGLRLRLGADSCFASGV